MSGDPRAAFVDGVDTTKPNPVHSVKDTGIHGVGTGDPRAAWQSNSAVDQAAIQEEKDLRRAVKPFSFESLLAYQQSASL